MKITFFSTYWPRCSFIFNLIDSTIISISKYNKDYFIKDLHFYIIEVKKLSKNLKNIHVTNNLSKINCSDYYNL